MLLKDKGDPGDYEPQIYLSLSRHAQQSFNRSASEGKLLSGFGGQADRTLDFRSDAWNEGEKTPGPAGYTPQQDEKGLEWDMSVMNGAETMQMASFASKTPRIGEILPKSQVDIPGPGTYDPKDHLTINHLPGANPDSNPISMVNRDR